MCLFAAACDNAVKQGANDNADGAAAGGVADSSRAGAPAPVADQPTKQHTLRFKDYKFTLITKGDESMKDLILAVSNMKGDTSKADSIVQRDVKGQLDTAEIADLDKDGHPEIYCFSTSSGSGNYGLVYGFVYMDKKAIRIAPPEMDTALQRQYNGKDSFYIKAPYLVREFPVEKSFDPNIPNRPEDARAQPAAVQKKTLRYQLRKSADGYRLQQVK